MLVPIRCFTCGALIADKYKEYKERVESGEKAEEVLNSLNIRRYCCRRMFISTVEVIDQILPYHEALARRREELLHE